MGVFSLFPRESSFQKLKTAGECGSGGQKQSSKKMGKTWLAATTGWSDRDWRERSFFRFSHPLERENNSRAASGGVMPTQRFRPHRTMRRDTAPTEDSKMSKSKGTGRSEVALGLRHCTSLSIPGRRADFDRTLWATGGISGAVVVHNDGC